MWDFLWRHVDTLIILFVLWNISFRLNAISRAQDHNFTEILKQATHATQSAHQSLGNIRTGELQRCSQCEATLARPGGSE